MAGRVGTRVLTLEEHPKQSFQIICSMPRRKLSVCAEDYGGLAL